MKFTQNEILNFKNQQYFDNPLCHELYPIMLFFFQNVLNEKFYSYNIECSKFELILSSIFKKNKNKSTKVDSNDLL